MNPVIIISMLFFGIIIISTILITVYKKAGNKINKFIEFINKKDYNSIVNLLKNNVNINVSNHIGRTPLMLAIIANDEYLVKLFLGNGADIHCKDINGDTPLLIAAEINNFEIIKILLKANPIINATNKKGETPLFKSVKKGNYDLIKLFIENKANVNIAAQNPKRTILLGALSRGKSANDKKIIKLLIKNGADINEPDDFLNYPVNFCVAFGLEDILELLIENKVNLDVRDSTGSTPLIQSLITNPVNYNIVKLLLNSKINIHIKNYHGDDALIIATRKNEKKAIQLLNRNQV